MPTATQRTAQRSARAHLVRTSAEALAWITFGAVLWVLTYRFGEASDAYRLGTASWPRAVLILLFICAALQWLDTIRKPPAESASTPRDEKAGLSLPLLAIFALPLIYAWLLPRTGFFATTPIFAAALFWLLGEHVWWRLVVATVTLWVGLLLVFSVLLYVPLPTGNWPGFYDFSNFILSVIR